MRELHEADFHKPGIYGSGRVWANAWDVFRRSPSRGGRGRRVAVDFVVCFGWGGFFRFFFFDFFFFERTRPAASMRPPCLIYLSTSTGARTGCHYLISVSVCVTFVLLLIARGVRGRFPQTRALCKRASVGERVGRVSSHVVSRWSRSPGCCGFRGVF